MSHRHTFSLLTSSGASSGSVVRVTSNLWPCRKFKTNFAFRLEDRYRSWANEVSRRERGRGSDLHGDSAQGQWLSSTKQNLEPSTFVYSSPASGIGTYNSCELLKGLLLYGSTGSSRSCFNNRITERVPSLRPCTEKVGQFATPFLLTGLFHQQAADIFAECLHTPYCVPRADIKKVVKLRANNI